MDINTTGHLTNEMANSTDEMANSIRGSMEAVLKPAALLPPHAFVTALHSPTFSYHLRQNHTHGLRPVAPSGGLPSSEEGKNTISSGVLRWMRGGGRYSPHLYPTTAMRR